jgi:outer membrane protein insertion porin family/translocation and assembly module TamA
MVPAVLVAQTPRDNKAEMERPEIRDLKLVGVKNVQKGELLESLDVKESGCLSLLLKPFCLVTKSPYVYERAYLDREEFRRDVIRLLVFYFRRGYRDAHVDTTITPVGPNAVKITLAVTEGPPTVVTQSSFEGLGDLLSRRDTARVIRPKVGEPLNVLRLDSSLVDLRELLFERGYADAQLTPQTTVNDSTKQAQVRVTIEPKKRVTIGEIRIEGNERIPDETVRKSLFVEPGDLFRMSAIGRSQRALYESNLFRRALIDTLPAQDSVKGLRITLTEAPQREARTSFGFTTADFVQAEARFVHHYLFNGPREFNASLTVGNLLAQQLTKSKVFVDISNIVVDNDLGRFYAPTYVASLDMRQRWFQSARNTIGLGVFSHRRSAPGVFIDRGYGANATFTRELAIRTPLSASYRFEISRVEAGDVYFCVNYGVCDDPTVDALRGQQRLSPVALTLSANRTDAPLSPTRGFRARAEAEHASGYTASDFRYNRAQVDIAAYLPLPFRKAVGAAHFRAGWVKSLGSTAEAVNVSAGGPAILHPRKRFYAGGSQSVRGFGENQLGPRVLTIAPDVLLRGEHTENGETLYHCALADPIESCDVNADYLRDEDFQVRPLGGTTVIEGSIELRIPVWRQLHGAVFLDGAILGAGSINNITQGTGALTPGFGVRYESPVGPIRVDLGVRPTLQRALPVVTEVRGEDGQLELVDLSPPGGCHGKVASPGCRVFPNPDEKLGFLRRLSNRLTLHLSIGQAF